MSLNALAHSKTRFEPISFQYVNCLAQCFFCITDNIHASGALSADMATLYEVGFSVVYGFGVGCQRKLARRQQQVPYRLILHGLRITVS